MTENMMAFLAAASEKPEYADKLQNATKEDILELAKELGFTLSEEDLVQPAAELNDDELDVVSGGSGDVGKHGGKRKKDPCACVAYGSGKEDNNDETCSCIAFGDGYTKAGKARCYCASGGGGTDT